MRAFDGADTCELVGNFVLYKLSEKYERKILALERDDGLAICRKFSGPAPEKRKKCFCKLFREPDLELTIKWNRKVVLFLAITLNLENSSFCYFVILSPKRQK